MRVYAPWFLSRHNKDLKGWTLKPPRRVTALGSWTDLFKLAILLSLIAMTRMDMVLAFVPAIVFGYLFRRESCSFIKAALIGLAGLMPFILWELFATFYYGFPFPNTAYVKLGASMPLLDYIIRGQDYFFATLLFDPIVVLVPIISIFLVAIKKDIKPLNGLRPANELVPEGNCTPLQYSCLENPMDRGAR